jgi:hypothetical protein
MPGIVDLVLADQRARGIHYKPWMEETAPARTRGGKRPAGRPAKRVPKPARAGAAAAAKRTVAKKKPARRAGR